MNDNKRTIIITGGGSGIGMETAIKFADNGYNVIICLLYTSDAADE